MRNKNFKEVKETKDFIYMPKTYFNIIDGFLWCIAGLIGMIKFNNGSITFNFIVSCIFFCLGAVQWVAYFCRPAKYIETVQLCHNIENVLNSDFNAEPTIKFIYDNEEKIILRKNICYNVFNWFISEELKVIEVHSKKFKEIEGRFFNDK